MSGTGERAAVGEAAGDDVGGADPFAGARHRRAGQAGCLIVAGVCAVGAAIVLRLLPSQPRDVDADQSAAFEAGPAADAALR